MAADQTPEECSETGLTREDCFETREESPKELCRVTEELYVAKYQKAGFKSSQASKMPELEEAIAKQIADSKKGIIWPDQNSDSYQKEVIKVSDGLIGKQLNPK